MDTATVVENLIVGTGPSAVSAAMALQRLGQPFLVIDAGFDLEPERESRIEEIARQGAEAWTVEDRRTLFPPPKTSTKGVEKRLAFGSDFPYRVPQTLEIVSEDCVVDTSHGFGGFGNVWGAAILPYSDNDLVGWPITAADLAASIRRVLQFVPISSEPDDLEQVFPRFDDRDRGLIASEQIRLLARALERRKPALRRNGIWVGRSRVAVDSAGGATTCRYCGYCLDGCAYGSIFNPRNVGKVLRRDGVVRQGSYALEFREQADWVDVVLVDLGSGRLSSIRARRLFLGMGAINSTRIVARSLGLRRRPIRLKDSQYFFFPLFSYRPASAAPSFTLAELFVEVLNPRIGPYFTHFQVYGLNPIFQQTIRALVPRFLRRPSLLKGVEKRFFLFQGFLHSEHSGGLELTLDSSEQARDRVLIRGRTNPDSLRVARGAQRLLRKELLGFGVIPPLYLKMVPLGRSFHVGGSFPMGGEDPVFRSDHLGRPAGLERVHLLDAATFPSIPATTITLAIMANADRVISETVGG